MLENLKNTTLLEDLVIMIMYIKGKEEEVGIELRLQHISETRLERILQILIGKEKEEAELQDNLYNLGLYNKIWQNLPYIQVQMS